MDNTKENVLRLLFVAKQKGVKISHLNELIGGYRGKLTDVKNGKSTLKQDEFDILRDFLMSDEFDKQTIASNSVVNSPITGDNSNIYNSTLSNDERELIDIYNSLSIFQKGKLFSFLEELKRGE